MKLKKSKVIAIIFTIIVVTIIIYFSFNKSPQASKQNNPITYETINMLTNLRLGISEFDTITPYITNNREVIYINSLIFEPLVTITSDYKIETCLAQEWSKVDKKSYIVKLKENVKWSNGSKLTSKDVKFSIEELKKLKSSIYYENIKNIEKVEAIDELTIRIELEKEMPFFEYHLIFPIVSEKQYEKDEIKTSKQIPIGTGKYKIDSLNEGKIELTKNENFRETEENSNIKKIEIYLYETMGDVYNNFKLGNIDLFHTSNDNIEEYIGSMGYGKKEYANREYDYLALNCEDTILQYGEVRKAISLALDQEKIVAVLESKVQACNFPLEEENYLIKEEKESYKSNVEKAKKTLEEAGWKYEYGIWQKKIDGRTKTININLSVSKDDEQRVKVAQEIKKQLEVLGIKLEIEEITNAKYQNYLKKHQYEMLLTGVYTPISPDLSEFFEEKNLANYKNSELATILQELNNITEEEILKEKYKQIIKIYEEDVPYIGLYRNKNTIVYTTSFRGDITPNNYNIYYNFSNWYRID